MSSTNVAVEGASYVRGVLQAKLQVYDRYTWFSKGCIADVLGLYWVHMRAYIERM